MLKIFIIKKIKTVAQKTIIYYKHHGIIKLSKRIAQEIKINLLKFLQYKTHAKSIAHVQSILDNKKAIILPDIFLYDMPMFQRPQHIARELGALGWNYIFVEPFHGSIACRQVEKNVWTISSIIGEKHTFLKPSLNLNKKSILHLYATEHKDRTKLIQHARAMGAGILYEYVDEIHPDLSGQQTPDYIINRHNDMLSDSTVKVVATASKLYEECVAKRNSTKNIVLIPNGTEWDHFAKARRDIVPEKIRHIINNGKPIIGYFGALASWFDYELLIDLAKLRAEYDFVLIGIDYDKSMAKYDIEDIQNIHYLGLINYKELPQYGVFFDTAIIPFKINEITLSTSPIKLFEYMSLGLESVTTEMPECKKYPYVYTAKNSSEFISLIDKNITRSQDMDLKSKIKNFVRHEHSWGSRAKQICDFLEK